MRSIAQEFDTTKASYYVERNRIYRLNLPDNVTTELVCEMYSVWRLALIFVPLRSQCHVFRDENEGADHEKADWVARICWLDDKEEHGLEHSAISPVGAIALCATLVNRSVTGKNHPCPTPLHFVSGLPKGSVPDGQEGKQETESDEVACGVAAGAVERPAGRDRKDQPGAVQPA